MNLFTIPTKETGNEKMPQTFKYRGRFLWIWELKLYIGIKKWNGTMKGITTMTQDGYHILTIDWDDKKPELIEYQLRAMQQKYQLGNIYIIESSPECYHSICFDKLGHPLQREILSQLDCDANYKNIKKLVLRISAKNGNSPKLMKVLYSNNNKYQKSRAHIIYYGNNIPEMKDYLRKEENKDNFTHIIETEYTT